MNTLPQDITNIINDMVCKKRSNGKSSHNIVVNVRLNENEDAFKNEDIVLKWLLKSLENKCFDYLCEDGQYDWHIVSAVRNNFDEADDDYGDGRVVIIAIHYGKNLGEWIGCRWCEDDLTIINETPIRKTISADDVLNSLQIEPKCVSAVGVSGVSDKLMSKLWWEIVSEYRNTLEGEGKGYMVHPMWNRYRDKEDSYFWSSVREMSYNFGWEKYPPN